MKIACFAVQIVAADQYSDEEILHVHEQVVQFLEMGFSQFLDNKIGLITGPLGLMQVNQ